VTDKTYADLTAASDMQDADLLASWRPAGPGPLKKIQASVVKAYMLVGLGTASEEDTGTSGHTVPFLDGANAWSAAQTVINQTAGDSSAAVANTRFVTSAIAAFNSRGYIDGLTLSTAGSSATFGVAAGVALDSTNVSAMALASAFTKTTGAWTVGTGNGALLTGVIANGTWYHAFEIQRPDSGLVDIGLDTIMDPTAHLPTNYTLFRYIGSMLTDGSAHWVKFIQHGDEFLWADTATTVTGGVGTGGSTRTLPAIPPGISVSVLIKASAQDASGNAFILHTSPEQNTQTASLTNSDFWCGASSANATCSLSVRTNTSAQIHIVTSENSCVVSTTVNGWIDTRGRNS
jgi:hypothetical protein